MDERHNNLQNIHMSIKIHKGDEICSNKINTSALFPFAPVIVMTSQKLGSILCVPVPGNLDTAVRGGDTQTHIQKGGGSRREGGRKLEQVHSMAIHFFLRDLLSGPHTTGVTKECVNSD